MIRDWSSGSAREGQAARGSDPGGRLEPARAAQDRTSPGAGCPDHHSSPVSLA